MKQDKHLTSPKPQKLLVPPLKIHRSKRVSIEELPAARTSTQVEPKEWPGSRGKVAKPEKKKEIKGDVKLSDLFLLARISPNETLDFALETKIWDLIDE